MQVLYEYSFIRERGVKVKKRKNKPTAVDLFAGAGGLSLGFEEAGFQVLLAVEKEPYSAETYIENRRSKKTIVLMRDIADLNPLEILRVLGVKKGEIDIVIGGPPCQGFSTSNMRTRTLDNPKNHLYKEFIRFIKSLTPKWFLLENVAGMNSFKGGLVKNVIIGELENMGYSCKSRILNTAEYGIPQIRRRIFIIGNRISADFIFPNASHGDGKTAYTTVKEAISDLPLLENGNQKDLTKYAKSNGSLTNYKRRMRANWGKPYCRNNLVSKNTDLVLRRYQFIPQGGNWENIPSYLMRNYKNKRNCHSGIYKRLKWNEPSVVISNYRKCMLIHPDQDRGLSVREAARLQSFPDKYIFYGPLGYQQQQVANAVPPILAQKIAMAILGFIGR